MRNFRHHFSLEELFARSFDDAPHRLAFVAIACWIASLRDESLLDCVEQIEVVVAQFAEFDEIETGFRAFLDEEVNGDIAKRRFNDYRHLNVLRLLRN